MLRLRLLKKITIKQNLKQNLTGFRFTSDDSTKKSQCLLPDGTSFKDKILCSIVGMTCRTGVAVGLPFAVYKCFFDGIPTINISKIGSTDKCCQIVKYSYMTALVFFMLVTYGFYQILDDDLKRILGIESSGNI